MLMFVLGTAMLLGTPGSLVTSANSASSPSNQSVGQPGSDVTIGGVTVCRFVEPFRGLSAQQRSAVVYQRIWQVFNSESRQTWGSVADRVHVQCIKGDYVVQLGDYVIITVDESHARYISASPEELASIWASNLKRALQSFVAINAPKDEGK